MPIRARISLTASVVLSLTLAFGAGCGNDAPIPRSPIASEVGTQHGITVLVLRGSHSERGYAHGFLIGDRVKEVYDGFFIQVFFNGREQPNEARMFLQDNFTIERVYWEEAQAMIDGMRDARVALYNHVLSRDIDAFDLLMLNSIEELIDVTGFYFGKLERQREACSSLSSWGEATAADPELEGELVITRHWDWPPHKEILNNCMLIVHCPAETDEQKWVSAGWAGVMGACSGMNESGVGSFLNYGDVPDHSQQDRFQNVSLSLRNAIEQRDYNRDGDCTTDDVVDALDAYRPYFACIVHAVASVAEGDEPIVIECNNAKGLSVRDRPDNRDIRGPHLVVTNHFRKLYEPVACKRYESLVLGLADRTTITCRRSEQLVASAAGTGWCMYRLQYVPVDGTLRYSSGTVGTPAHKLPLAELELQALFGDGPDRAEPDSHPPDIPLPSGAEVSAHAP